MTKGLRLLVMAALTLGILVPVQSQASSLDGTLNVEMETADRATGTVHILTATLTAVSGMPASIEDEVIGFEIEGGPQDPDSGAPFVAANPSDMECVTNASGVCTVTHSATAETAAATPQEITGWHEESPAGTCPGATCIAFPDDADIAEAQNEGTTPGAAEPDDTDVVSVEWFDAVLNLEPEAVTTPVGVAQTLTATVLEKEPPTPPAATLLANVDVEITAGPNANSNSAGADFECDTAQGTGSCTVSYTGGTTAGADTVRAHIDNNDNGVNAPATGAAGDEVPGEADTTEGQNEATTPGGTAEGDRTDVITVTRSVTVAPPPPPPPPPAPPPAPKCAKKRGTKGDDTLRGKAGCDKLLGRGGDDKLFGKGGNDVLRGGGGFDICRGGPGKDRYRSCERIKGKIDKL